MNDIEEFYENPKLKCKVCGEHKFSLREGFYYCVECGTKQDQIREIEIEEEEFNDTKIVKKLKIEKVKAEKPELTSWEFYNYILRGFVSDLFSIGAKDDLKLMTLQLWAAYLHRMEVAFFDKKHAGLPKLGVRFLPRDATVLYNHAISRHKLKRKRSETASLLSSERSSARKFRKSKRKLDESMYNSSQLSQELSHTSLSTANTSSTGTTKRPIKLKFSGRARKHLKKKMPQKHIETHAEDAEGSLKCHNLRPLAKDVKRAELRIETLNVKQVYAILGIALNLSNDDIQLSDLVRFVDEEHITSKKVLQYFPENIVPHCKQLLQELQFNQFPTKYTDKMLRDQVSALAKFLNVRHFITTDILKLAMRYITDLNLPPDIGVYVDRLISLLPPQMCTRAAHIYPAYEARAMAYIIFVLKLLFGLDGHKEKLMSHSAIKINQEIKVLSNRRRSEATPSLLFVYQDWVEFIEMRKVIVSYYNSKFCRQFNQCQSTAQLIEDMEEEQRQQQEANLESTGIPEMSNKVSNLNLIFKQYVKEFDVQMNKNDIDPMAFPPSLTPAHSYFRRILLHHSNFGGNDSLKIPEFMRVDHMQRAVNPLINETPLLEFFKLHKRYLKVEKIACTNRRSYVGIFRTPLDSKDHVNRMKKFEFGISKEEWLKSLDEEPAIEELEFKTELQYYEKKYLKKLQLNALKRQQKPDEFLVESLRNNETNMLPHTSTSENEELFSTHSANIFSENDMEPNEIWNLTAPRRNLNQVRLFEKMPDDVSETEEKTSNNVEEIITLVTSEMDYWTLIGNGLAGMTGVQKKILQSKFTRTFFWLLETCAQTINVEWSVVYEQLLAIELMFAYGVDDLDNFEDCVKYKYNNPIKDINTLVNLYREIW